MNAQEREAQRQYNKKYYQMNKEKRRAYAREYYRTNKDKVKQNSINFYIRAEKEQEQ